MARGTKGDEEMEDGAAIISFNSHQLEEITEYFSTLIKTARDLQKQLMSKDYGELNEPIHLIHLNTQSIINICEAVLTALTNVERELKKRKTNKINLN